MLPVDPTVGGRSAAEPPSTTPVAPPCPCPCPQCIAYRSARACSDHTARHAKASWRTQWEWTPTLNTTTSPTSEASTGEGPLLGNSPAFSVEEGAQSVEMLLRTAPSTVLPRDAKVCAQLPPKSTAVPSIW